MKQNESSILLLRYSAQKLQMKNFQELLRQMLVKHPKNEKTLGIILTQMELKDLE